MPSRVSRTLWLLMPSVLALLLTCAGSLWCGRQIMLQADGLHIWLGVMINGSFVFGLDADDKDVFARTVDWAVNNGLTTATFHILTPYPGTALYERMLKAGRILHQDWDLYDTRHTVFRPTRMTPSALEKGYRGAYKEFYRWRSIM